MSASSLCSSEARPQVASAMSSSVMAKDRNALRAVARCLVRNFCAQFLISKLSDSSSFSSSSQTSSTSSSLSASAAASPPLTRPASKRSRRLRTSSSSFSRARRSASANASKAPKAQMTMETCRGVIRSKAAGVASNTCGSKASVRLAEAFWIEAMAHNMVLTAWGSCCNSPLSTHAASSAAKSGARACNIDFSSVAATAAKAHNTLASALAPRPPSLVFSNSPAAAPSVSPPPDRPPWLGGKTNLTKKRTMGSTRNLDW
mmetsp:Transcript_148673/g.370444  ORF Transcript_148673/g.370444 Transcript_148673/m.370444 type:complete len:260 (-) Transcript_148673:1195-1974(-)